MSAKMIVGFEDMVLVYVYTHPGCNLDQICKGMGVDEEETQLLLNDFIDADLLYEGGGMYRTVKNYA